MAVRKLRRRSVQPPARSASPAMPVHPVRPRRGISPTPRSNRRTKRGQLYATVQAVSNDVDRWDLYDDDDV